MKIMLTTTDKLTSRLIRWGLKEPGSHIAIQWSSEFVVHCSFFGCKPEWSSKFLGTSRIIKSVEILLTDRELEETRARLSKYYYDDAYDYGGFFYYVISVLAHRFLKVKLPKQNKWQDPEKSLCTNVIKAFPEWVWESIRDRDIEVTSPYQVITSIRGAK